MNEFSQYQPQAEQGGIGRSIMLLGLGIFIGSTLGITGCWLMGIGGSNRAPQAHSAAAAGAMENLGAPPQTDLSEPAPAAASGYVDGYTDGHSISALQQAPIQAGLSPNGAPMVQPAQPPIVHYVQTGMPLTLPGQGQPEIITTTTIYPGQRVGASGVRPCVDPPSVRGRAYSRTMQ